VLPNPIYAIGSINRSFLPYACEPPITHDFGEEDERPVRTGHIFQPFPDGLYRIIDLVRQNSRGERGAGARRKIRVLIMLSVRQIILAT
jgi:hypothetical protein